MIRSFVRVLRRPFQRLLRRGARPFPESIERRASTCLFVVMHTEALRSPGNILEFDISDVHRYTKSPWAEGLDLVAGFEEILSILLRGPREIMTYHGRTRFSLRHAKIVVHVLYRNRYASAPPDVDWLSDPS